MRTRVRDLVYGRCATAPLTARQVEGERIHRWRRPFDVVTVPGHHGPDSVLYKVFFFLGVPPGWKFTIYQHNDTDPMPPHSHAGRIFSFILWGGYIEERLDSIDSPVRCVLRKPFSINWLPTQTYHRIIRLPRKKAYTFVVIFPTVQQPEYAVNGRSVPLMDYWRGEYGSVHT